MASSSKQVDQVFRALGNKRRREIVQLVMRGVGAPSAIAREFDCTWPAISRHLRILTDAKVLEAKDQKAGGKRQVYVVNHPALASATGWLREVGKK